MLIKPSTKHIESVNDIYNIKQARRFVFIYKYNSPKRALMLEAELFPKESLYYDGDLYGIYLVNISTIDGIGYLIPEKYMVHSRNGYSGSCRNALNPDGSINMNAEVNLYTASYSNRIHNKSNNLSFESAFNTINALATDYGAENEMLNILHSSVAAPMPIYYNFEEQARLAETSFKDIDFVMNYCEIQPYRLADLIDHRTSVMVVSVDGEKNNPILDQSSEVYEFGNSNSIVNMESIRDLLLNAFTDCFTNTLESVFSEVYYVFDLSSGLFNIPKESLKLKFNYGTRKEDIIDSYEHMLSRASVTADNISSNFSTNYDDCPAIALPQWKKSGGGTIFDLFPEKLYIHTSLSTCSLKLVCSSIYGLNNEKTNFHMNICSTGDTDELTQTMFQTEYPHD